MVSCISDSPSVKDLVEKLSISDSPPVKDLVEKLKSNFSFMLIQ